jgi:hypothetical protein
MKDTREGCQGYSSFNGEGLEYDCDYEFGEDCGSCLFNSNLPLECRKVDPRVDPNEEEEE